MLWMAFLSETQRFGVAAVLDELEVGESAVLSKEAAVFSGDPHYFYWGLILNEVGSLVTVPRGGRYSVRYWLYFFEFDELAEVPGRVSNFRESQARGPTSSPDRSRTVH